MVKNQEVKEIQKKRFLFLHRLYELNNGMALGKYIQDAYLIGSELGFDKDLTRKILYYLKWGRLIELGAGNIITITHEGVKVVQEALLNPEQPTQYFPPTINIISIEQMVNSQVQQASPGATQVVTISLDKNEELKQIIQLLKESIDKLSLQPQQKLELEAEIITIETQMSSPKPKSTIIAECLKSIRNILEGVASGMIASGLLNKIASLLAG